MQVARAAHAFSQMAHASKCGCHFFLTSRTDSTRVRLRDSHRQHSMNPARCQPTTVCGCTIMSARLESDQNRRKASQRKLSEVSGMSFGCRAFRTPSCCRPKSQVFLRAAPTRTKQLGGKSQQKLERAYIRPVFHT